MNFKEQVKIFLEANENDAYEITQKGKRALSSSKVLEEVPFENVEIGMKAYDKGGEKIGKVIAKTKNILDLKNFRFKDNISFDDFNTLLKYYKAYKKEGKEVPNDWVIVKDSLDGRYNVIAYGLDKIYNEPFFNAICYRKYSNL